MSAEAAGMLASTEVADMLRACRTCGIAKPLVDFRSEVRRDGTRHRYRASCRKCENAKKREWYQQAASAPLAVVLPLGEFATQVCRTCEQALPFDQFGRNMAMCTGLKRNCKKCEGEYSREWVKRNPDKAYNSHLLRAFGISLDEYNVILERQDGMCAICGELPDGPRNQRKGGRNVFKARLVVDHDHATGKVRGLLCNNCNAAIGLLKDDQAMVGSALAYLDREG